MRNPKTVQALFEDLGVPVKHKETLKQDIFTYFYHLTGSEKKTCGLPRASIPAHIEAFIDAEEGREWFNRVPDTDVWFHPASRPKVGCALTELTIRWFKSRRALLKKQDASSMTKKKNTLPGDPTSSKVDRSPQLSSSRTAFTAVNTEHATEDSEYHAQTFEYSDEETDPCPDDSGKTDDDESLMDITEVLSTPVKAPSTRPTTASPSVSTNKRKETMIAPRDQPESSLPTKPNIPEPSLPAQKAGQTLLSPPLIGSKRVLQCTGSEETTSLDNLDNREDPTPKKVRLAFGSMSPQSTVSETHIANQDSVVQLNGVSADSNLRAATSSTVGEEIRLPSQEPALMALSLSNTNPFHQNAIYSMDALGSVPAMILDYIAHCRQSSLAKANAAGKGALERKQYQERCKLFRDLHADIESRILSLAHNPIKEAIKADDGDVMGGETDTHEREMQVSSFCLWD